jgi:hypothetical protein
MKTERVWIWYDRLVPIKTAERNRPAVLSIRSKDLRLVHVNQVIAGAADHDHSRHGPQ